MTETRQGVAQRVLSSYQMPHTRQRNLILEFQERGATRMYRELSHEARQLADELRLGSVENDPDLSTEDRIHAAGFAKGYRHLADYLGLDLNEPEAE